METVKIAINGMELDCPAGATILEASKAAERKWPGKDFRIPTLYYYKGLVDKDLSGVCIANVEGRQESVNASLTRVEDGMEIVTDSPELYLERKKALEQIVEIYDYDGEDCSGNETNELLPLLREYGVTPTALKAEDCVPVDTSNEVFDRNNNQCIRCGRCANICGKIQSVGAIRLCGEGLEARVEPNADPFISAMKSGSVNCTGCGQCITVCPTGALTEKNHIMQVREALQNPEKYVVVQAAPAVRAALGEAFGMPVGTDVEGRLAAALRRLGFDKVFDTVTGADLTVMEEAYELIRRMREGGTLPMITSCCPGWVNYCEIHYADLTMHLSSCKSPHMMYGAVIKSYYAEKKGIAKENIVVVSVMPCTAKKYEITRDDECGAGVPDVDYVLTTRELAKMLKEDRISFAELEEETFDASLDIGSGAGVIFGATGGVMEAALRTAAEALTGESVEKTEFTDVRGIAGMKEASYELNGQTIKVAVVSGLENVRKMLDRVRGFKTDYQFIEVMACPGGCVNGGGQPRVSAETAEQVCVREKRAAALYANDENRTIRKSHENPVLKELYGTYLGEPGSERAHELLHTSYHPR